MIILIHLLWVGAALVRLFAWRPITPVMIFWLLALLFTPIPFVVPIALGIASYLPERQKRKRHSR
ncbi:MAG: hypothetical protein OHK0046_52200 [Anaerolineae bacterium]